MLNRLGLLTLILGCGESASPPPTTEECLAACARLESDCGLTYDCPSLCRDLRAGELSCLDMHGPSFVDCALNLACDETCQVDAIELYACNDVFCDMLPDDPLCAEPELVTECSDDATDLPPYDRACEVGASECGLFFHQVDCCGTTHAAAYATRVQEQVLAAEESCRAMLSDCDCAPGPVRDEEGTEVPVGETVSAMCVEGTCRALVE